MRFTTFSKQETSLTRNSKLFKLTVLSDKNGFNEFFCLVKYGNKENEKVLLHFI